MQRLDKSPRKYYPNIVAREKLWSQSICITSRDHLNNDSNDLDVVIFTIYLFLYFNTTHAYLIEQPRAEYDLEKIICDENIPQFHRFSVGHKSRSRNFDGEHVRSAYQCRG